MACVGCGAPVGDNHLKYTREMCLRCYARMLGGQPVGERGAEQRAPPAAVDEKKPRG